MPELYPFQREDMEKLVPLHRGAIGSEMGTGKTPVAVEIEKAWYDDLKTRGKDHYGTLVVAPLNTFDGWRKRYDEWSPESDLVQIDRKNREAFIQAVRMKRGDVFLTHWESLRLMPELRNYPFATIIADEAHRMAARNNQQTQSLKMLRTFNKLAMSGTMSADHPAGLWSPFHWLYPQEHFVTSYWRFYKLLVDYEIDYNKGSGYHKILGVNLDNIHRLHEFMDPFWVRHLKRGPCCAHHPQGVMSWLPEKVYDRIWIDLLPKQRKVYEAMKAELLAWVGENEDKPLAAPIEMVKMTRLSQISLAMPDIRIVTHRRFLKHGEQFSPKVVKALKMVSSLPDGDWWLVEEEEVFLIEPSEKLDRGVELFKDHPNKQFVAYTSSKHFLRLAMARFAKVGITATSISGDVNSETERTARKDMFIRGDVQVILIMIQASEGIDGLQEATDTAVFFDRSQSARMNMQAEDRLHRDGQKNTVQIIDIMARNTVDLGRHQRLKHKWEWLKLLLGDKVNQETGEER